jgi:4-hydroxyproline epimerase
MSDRRQDFLDRFDWIRTGLMFEPRGHDMMSGGFILPPASDDCDAGILFIETSGCLPMCGHGTIGIVTMGLEHGLLYPSAEGRLRLEVPAGKIEATYRLAGERVESVRLTNVASYVAATGLCIDVPGLGPLVVDIAYGGNYYAIVEPQESYPGLEALGTQRLLALSPIVRQLVRQQCEPVHPLDPTINGVSHVLWADRPNGLAAHGRNAVFYGDHAIDRSPCGTGTSARLAQLAARGELATGDSFVNESIIGSRFIGRIEAETRVGRHPAIVPSIEGSAHSTGFSQIRIDRQDPLWRGFQIS